MEEALSLLYDLCLLLTDPPAQAQCSHGAEGREGKPPPSQKMDSSKSSTWLPQPSQLQASSFSSHGAGVCAQSLTHSEHKARGVPARPAGPVFLSGKKSPGLRSTEAEVLGARVARELTTRVQSGGGSCDKLIRQQRVLPRGSTDTRLCQGWDQPTRSSASTELSHQ